MDWNFDANAVAPRQGVGAHPVGNKFPFRITNVEVAGTKDNSGGMLVVELTSDAGSIKNRYNIWNSNDTARKIAGERLSALCHAVGRFKIGAQQGKELIGGQGLMDIGFQKGEEPSAEKPAGGYVELKTVYTSAGLEPGTAQQPAAAATQQQQQTTGFVAAAPANPPPAPQQAAQSWGQQPAPAAQPQQQPPANGGGWNAGGSAPTETPPWNS
jgi:hypothetical protein